MESKIFFYHGGCVDGFTAAWVAWRKHGDSAQYRPIYHKDPRVEDIENKHIVFLDFCPKPDHLDYYIRKARTVLVLDHHISAYEECKQYACCRFDMKSSGAGMAYDYYIQDRKRSGGSSAATLVNYVEDRDLWNWKLPQSREISAYIHTFPLGDFAEWDKLAGHLSVSLDSCAAKGALLLHALDQDNQQVRQRARLETIGGYVVPCVNVSHGDISSLLNSMVTDDVPFAAGWCQQKDGTFRYSLRSVGDFDVSKVAALYGGGGHKNAAGFSSSEIPSNLP